MIYATLSRKKEKDGLSALPHFTVRLVPDTDNQYDPEWAIGVYVPTSLYGNKFIGHVSARGYCVNAYCTQCDENQRGKR
jgi:hypothetical protein